MIWTAEVDPSVLSVSATPSPGATFDLAQLRFIVSVDDERIEHVALDYPGGVLRLDVIGGSVLRGRADLAVHVPINGHTPLQLKAFDRLLRLLGLPDAGRRSAPPDPRLPRLVEALRVADALAEGTSLAGIAAGLAGEDQLSSDWPGAGEHVKSAVRRKVALARRLVTFGPAGVLSFRT